MFLGVDGGATKTEFCLIDGRGAVAATLTTTGCSYLSVGFAELGRILEAGVKEVCGQIGSSVDAIEFAFFGLPCYGESSWDQVQLDDAPSHVLPRSRYRCDNDMVCGWAGSLGAADGINVIAGTGSMTYGEHGNSKARCGGWGELFGDEGSAYWIAIQGLSCFARMSDGRLEKGSLYEQVREGLHLSSDLDILDLVLSQWKGDRAKIASLSHLVVEAAEAGGGVARDILRRAARELALLVDATRRSLAFSEDQVVPVSYSGGMFKSGRLFLQAFQDALADLQEHYSLRLPLFSPALGAALYAAKLHGSRIDIASLPRAPGAGGKIESAAVRHHGE